MKGRTAAMIVAGLFCTGFTVVRDAGTSVPIVWPSGSVTVNLHSAGSDDVADGTDLAALRAALAVWAAPACSAFNLVDGGTSGTRGDATDGVNRLSFIEGGWPGGALGAVALTTRVRDTAPAPDIWIEVDITFNGTLKTNGDAMIWATDGRVHAFDIQSTATHELGHLLGLQHAPRPTASMYHAAREGLTYVRTLDADDIAGLCFLYPGAGFSCGADSDCPLYDDLYGSGAGDSRLRCVGASCVIGPAAYGEACFAGADCASGACMRGIDVPGSFDPGFCTMACVLGGSDCSGGDLCHAAIAGSGLSGPYCFSQHDDCVSHSDCVGSNNRRCDADLDGRFRCQWRCLADSYCKQVFDAAAVCHGGTGSNPPGFCRVPGAKALGELCQHGLECQSLQCNGGGSQPTCAESTQLTDGGPVTDGGSPREGGPDGEGMPDGNQKSDGELAIAGDLGSDGRTDDQGSIGGGCACNGSTNPFLLAILATFVRFRRRRYNWTQRVNFT